MELLAVLAAVAGVLSFIWIVFVGQKSLLEWWRERQSSRAATTLRAEAPEIVVPKKVYHNLPHPDYGTFVGREKELAKIRGLLSPISRHFLVTVDGVGGVGKSAVALEIAHRYLQEYDSLPEDERFDAIVWTSAKATVLTADGITARPQVTRTLDEIYTTISVALGREDITRTTPFAPPWALIHVLRHYATLFIGFSFRDHWVNGLLKRLNEEREERTPGDRLYHYALMRRDEVQSKGESFFRELGVKPIALNEFAEIPWLLGHLYQQALAQDYGEKQVELPIVEKQRGRRTGRHAHLSPTWYWDDLYACRKRAVRKRATAPWRDPTGSQPVQD